MAFPFGEPITVSTRMVLDERDEYGNDVTDETPVTVAGAFAPAIGYESTGDHDQVVSQPHAYLPAGTAVSASSVLVIRGDRYEVDGTPAVWRSPFSNWAPGIDVPLKRATG